MKLMEVAGYRELVFQQVSIDADLRMVRLSYFLLEDFCHCGIFT